MNFKDNRKGAVISDDEQYRYRLWRLWDIDKPALAFIMLNPSEADETENDPTLRRCIGYAKQWGYGEVILGNLFAYRTPNPDELEQQADPVGPANDAHLRDIAADADRIIAAWGAHDMITGRVREVVNLLDDDLYCLDTTKDGHPGHPLYQLKAIEPEPWSMDSVE